jgi:hypothetical protein
VHPYINKLIADERRADMRANAAAYRLGREAKARKRKSAEPQAARQEAPARPVPAQGGAWPSSEPLARRSSRHDDDHLVAAGKARGDQPK